ncbi:MAG: PAS domain S-box protein [Coleofasciculaceae cyanobacterium]
MNHSPRLVFVDDNPDDVALVMGELRRNFPDLQVELPTNDRELEQLLLAADFDVVIAESQLGWTTGITVLGQVKKVCSNCPVIMFTNRGSEEIAVAAMKAGIDDYIVKSPQNYSHLVTVVHQVLEQLRQQGGSARENSDTNKVIGQPAQGRKRQVLVEALQRRVSQQATIASFSQQALTGTDLATLMDTAVTLLAETLDVEYSKILELLPDQQGLLLRTGVGWQEGLVGQAIVGTETNSQAAYTLLCQQPVIVKDLLQETRFSGPSLLTNHGVISGMSVVIAGSSLAQQGELRNWDISNSPIAKNQTPQPFGILAVHTTKHRIFSQDDINFLQAIANILSVTLERKLREETLCQQAQLLNLANDAIIITKPDDTIDYWNQGAANLYGFSAEEALGQTCQSLLKTEFPQSLREVKARLLEEGYWPGELIQSKRNGKKIDISSRWTLQRDQEGNPSAILKVNHNITIRKRTENALRFSEAKLRRLVDANIIGIIFCDLSGNITEANDAFLQMVGYSRAELRVGKVRWTEMTPPEYEKSDAQAIAQLQATGTCNTYEKEYIRKDGTSVPILVGAALLENSEQNCICFVLDLSKRKQTEAALRESEERFRRAFIEAPFPVIIHAENNLEGEIIQINKAWSELTGYTAEELPSIAEWTEKAYGNRCQPVKEEIDSLYKLNHRVHEGEYEIKIKSGETRIWDFSSAPLSKLPDGRRLVISMAMDVTERKFSEALLAGQNKILEMIALDRALPKVLTAITQLIESQAQEAICAIVLLDETKTTLYYAAAPSLPEGFKQATPHGLVIEPNVGSCGTAAYRGEAVIASDIANDPRWADYKDFALAYGLRACWSIPIRDSSGEVLGTFAMYYRTPCSPSNRDWKLVELSIYLAGIAIESKRDKEALQESEQKFRANFEQAAVGIAHVAPDGRWIMVNQKLCDLLEYSRSELFECRFQDITHPDDLVADLAELERLRVGEIPSYSIEKRYICASGSPIWINLTVSVVRQKTGEPKYYIGVVKDIRERKHLEEALLRTIVRLQNLQAIDQAILAAQTPQSTAKVALERLRMLLPCPRLSVVVFDQKRQQATILAIDSEQETQLEAGSRIDLEPFATMLEPLRQGEIYHQPRLENLPAQPIVQGLLSEGFSSFQAIPLLAQQELVGALNLWYEPNQPLKEEQIAIAKEVSDQLAIAIRQSQLQQQLRGYTTELEKSVARRTRELQTTNAELEAFSYSVSHDLRAPLRAMQGFANALQEDCGSQLDELGIEYTERIIMAAQRLDGMTQDLLAYSRLGRSQIKIKPVSLASVVAEVIEQLEGEIKDRQAQVRVEEKVLKALPKVLGHRGTLVQVATNLVSNALKFVPESRQPQVKVWAEERTGAKNRAWVRLWVEDNGIGIQPEYQDRIFKVFERLHGRESYPGSGIGLAIVHKGIERIGGRSGVESLVGQGSKFWIEIPTASRGK